LKALGATPLMKELTDVVSSMDTMSASLSRIRTSIGRVTKALGIQSPALESFLKTLDVGANLVRAFTGSMELLSSVLGFKATGAIMKYLAKLWVLIATKWQLVTAQLALLVSNPFTIALAGVAIASIAMMISYVASLRAETERMTSAMGKLGEVTVKGSVFPEMVDWLKRLREEARKPIEVKVDVTTHPITRGVDVGRGIGEFVALELARRRRE